ncbi:hypothetical protein FRX31_010431 [Thalictrum thalictroides]|uniref:Uncharacterized protein n=1 Tax=Thalictrum thalictroides TaxID=46969 RepID=A0A7J6WV78_THATH|nr:hypothetical protein FRX31_010431 [Thalictrum thalictroides]
MGRILLSISIAMNSQLALRFCKIFCANPTMDSKYTAEMYKVKFSWKPTDQCLMSYTDFRLKRKCLCASSTKLRQLKAFRKRTKMKKTLLKKMETDTLKTIKAGGIKLVFRRVWKTGDIAKNQKLWEMTEQLEATNYNPSVTLGFNRLWNKFLVHHRWIEAANITSGNDNLKISFKLTLIRKSEIPI